MNADPVLIALAFSSLAALMGGVGALAFVNRKPSTVMLGVANSLAAGLMLGAAYALLVVGQEGLSLRHAAGAVAGIIYVFLSHRAAGASELELNRLDGVEDTYGYTVLLVGTLHGAAEGLAIGVAMAVSVPFGLFMALAIGVHNVPEGAVLSAILSSRGRSLPAAAALAVMANIGQILLTVVAFAVINAAPAALPWISGFAVGALVYLVMAELLPEGYREAGHTSVALAAIVALGLIVILSGLQLR